MYYYYKSDNQAIITVYGVLTTTMGMKTLYSFGVCSFTLSDSAFRLLGIRDRIQIDTVQRNVPEENCR